MTPAARRAIGPGAAGTRAKNAARSAVAKTDAHTRAVQQPITSTAGRFVAASLDHGTGLQRTDHPNVRRAAGVQPRRRTMLVGRGARGQGEVGFRREAFSYERSGRRDPFLSLLHSDDLRPMINDLKLVAVLYDPGRPLVGGHA